MALGGMALAMVGALVLWQTGAPGPPPEAGTPAMEGLAARFVALRAAIRDRQTAGGYWTTLHTSRPAFEDPRPEVNVYVPAIIVDLLAPVATETCLVDTLARARAYLGRQIEDSGLVRYHGRPDEPYLPALGCRITPDSDDTALAWTLAPRPDPARLQAALAVLARYRTEEGLYRTWLADRSGYECIDPGRDPNPADVAIQMHIVLFLARHDPQAGRALCQALQRHIDEDRIWVYYEAAPLVPLVREVDLARHGCPLSVPARRLKTVGAGQEAYLTLGRAFRDLLLRPGGGSAGAVLRALAQAPAGRAGPEGRVPPLLYHNDFSASTPRFYWSEDVGDALWLRTYVEAARRVPGGLPLPGCATGPR